MKTKIQTISITVFCLDEKNKVCPLRQSKYVYQREHNIVLLLIEKDDSENEEDNGWHYTLVKNVSRLLSKQRSNHDGKVHFCLRCLNGFYSHKILEKHLESCNNHDAVITITPEPDAFIEFKNHHHMDKLPFICYADMESMNVSMHGCDPDPQKSSTNKKQKHVPISFSYLIVCTDANVCEPIHKEYTQEKPEDPDPMDLFVNYLEEDSKAIRNIPRANPIFTEEDIKHFNECKYCRLCMKSLKNDKIRDHEYYTGKYRGAVHNKCYLNLKRQKHIPVVFHNLSGYDSHLFIKNLASTDETGKIDCIPNNQEKYISFTKTITTGEYWERKKAMYKNKTFKIRFIDCLKFMGTSLAKLANNLPDDAFKNLSKYYQGEFLELLKRKGVYPYDWMDDMEKLSYPGLPPQEAFYSKLSGEGISNEDYEHAKKVWEVFGCETFKDYHDLYNETDVLILADIFENFRDLCLANYGLDPAHYFTAPGLAWDACLKMTKVKLQLLSDPEMLLFFERLSRGGISMISNRYGKANNKYMGESFNPEELIKYLIYVDANNLYGYIMSQKLPTHGFQWLTEEEIENLFKNQTLETWEKTPCAIEVDLEYPKELHDLHNDYPVCAEKIITKNKIEKLIPNLRNKHNYVIHYRKLLQCLELGLKLKRIHRGIRFEESEWMKPYIDKNTKLRTEAKNEFEKDFFKLMNNAVFGKTMENKSNRVDVRLVTNKKQANKLIRKPNFRDFKIF